MKIFILCLIVCVFPSVGMAEAPRLENEQGDSNKHIEVSPPQKAQGNKQTQQEQLHWPRPYVPSEEISADSTVPFPADI